MTDKMDPAAYAATCLERMTSTLGIKTTASGSGSGKRITLKVKTDEPGRLIGRGGRVLNNFDYLLNRILAGKCEGQVRAEIDVEGGQRKRRDSSSSDSDKGSPSRSEEGGSRRERSSADSGGRLDEDRLKRLAGDAAKEVKRWGDAKTIGPFTAAERRVIHATLKDDPEIDTESGEELAGRRKKITISLTESEGD